MYKHCILLVESGDLNLGKVSEIIGLLMLEVGAPLGWLSWGLLGIISYVD